MGPEPPTLPPPGGASGPSSVWGSDKLSVTAEPERAAFLTPVLLMILERAGIVTLEQLSKSRRYAIVISAGAAAVLTPPDVVSMLLLLVPLYSLYEFAILAIRLTHWRAARREARSEDAAKSVEVPRTK